MIKLRKAAPLEAEAAMEIINAAKQYLKEQGIDQWQTGYPDEACIGQDIRSGKGYFVTDEDGIMGYLCIDYDGEPAYEHLKGSWQKDGRYVVVHRLALGKKSRGKGASGSVFQLVEEMARRQGIASFRVDTDADNQIMQHILKKNGFSYRGTIWFDNSEKIAFDKLL